VAPHTINADPHHWTFYIFEPDLDPASIGLTVSLGIDFVRKNNPSYYSKKFKKMIFFQPPSLTEIIS